jgi:hypothetical protein
MGLHDRIRNPKNLPDYLRERAIVDSKSGVMDLRDPAACPICGKSKPEAWPERIRNVAMVAFQS